MNSQTVKKRNIYFVILAGGSGTRLWPLSTSQCPKQLLVLANGKTLLEQTIELVRAYHKTPAQVWISTSRSHAPFIEKAIRPLVDHIIIEPEACNTGPSILYTCLQINTIDPDAIILFLPADSYIPQQDTSQFVTAIEQTLAFAISHEAIALLGAKPTRPATGYGYIEYLSEHVDAATGLHRVKKFHEKPSQEIAQEYIKQTTMLWNIGIFAAQVAVFLHEFKIHAPKLYQTIFDAFHQNTSFNGVPSISIDYALIERSTCVWVLPVDFSWCDVGNVSTFLSLKQQTGGLTEKLLTHNASNNLVDVPDKLVALVGVDNLCVVQTEDVLLILHSNEAENVRSIVDQLKKQKWHQYI